MYIKRPFFVQVQRGDYAIYIDKFVVTGGLLTGKALSFAKTTDWSDPVYVDVTEEGTDTTTEGATETATHTTTDRADSNKKEELRSEKRKERSERTRTEKTADKIEDKVQPVKPAQYFQKGNAANYLGRIDETVPVQVKAAAAPSGATMSSKAFALEECICARQVPSADGLTRQTCGDVL